MSEFIEIFGGVPLSGVVQISGAKNAALPLILSTLLTSERCQLYNVPNLTDTSLVVQLLEHFGAEVEFQNGSISTITPELKATDASYSLVKALRASFWVLAPLLARGRAARVALPGGDLIGARPVDIHLEGLAKMGADIKVRHGVVYATAVNGLKPVVFDLRYPSVGATHQLVMAAALTPGTTVLRGCAREPEVVAVCNFISQMGAEIVGAGGSTIEITGRSELGGASQTVIGDRIEAGTYLLAAAATSGRVKAQGIDPLFLGDFLSVLERMGLVVESGEDFVSVKASGECRPVDVVTGPFPELATDLQAPLMAVLTKAEGQSTLVETVYEGRFGHISELSRLGANIRLEDHVVKIAGRDKLSGAQVDALDIRAGAALVVAGLSAEGITQILEPHHIRRGYEGLEKKIQSLGGRCWSKVSDPEDFMFTGC